MERWKEDFIIGLRQGKPVSLCARMLAGLPLAAVYEAREADEEFAQAWDDACPAEDDGKPALMAGRVLTPAALEALMWAQCDDEEAAAYFGMEIGEFKGRVAADEALSKVYRIGPLGGKAALKRSQFERAMAGDGGMQTWLGKQHLGQAEKVEQTVKREGEATPQQIAERLMYIMAQAGKEMPVLEGIAVHVADEQDI